MMDTGSGGIDVASDNGVIGGSVTPVITVAVAVRWIAVTAAIAVRRIAVTAAIAVAISGVAITAITITISRIAVTVG